MFSTFDSLVFVFARFHGISKCPKTLQCLPLSLPPLYGVFSGSNGCTWHLTWLAFVDDEIQLFFHAGKNISPWCYLPRIEKAGQGPPKWPNPAGVPLDTDLRQREQWNFELCISQRAANSTQRVSCSQYAPGTDVEDLQSFRKWFLSTLLMACGHLLAVYLIRKKRNEDKLYHFITWNTMNPRKQTLCSYCSNCPLQFCALDI